MKKAMKYSLIFLFSIASLAISTASLVSAGLQEDLCIAAQNYYQEHSESRYRPPAADCTDNGDGTYTIHLYEIVDDGSGFSHTATSAWYKVDQNGSGKDNLFGDPIQLNMTGFSQPSAAGAGQYSSWSDAYFDFVLNGNYLRETDPAFFDTDPSFSYDTEISFAIFDMDLNGTPELIAFNGCDYMADSTCYVYTFHGGSMEYIGSVGFRDCTMTYYRDATYPGLFCRSGNMGYLMTVYYTVQNGRIHTENVLTENNNPDADPPLTRDTQDEVLYNKALNEARETLTMYTIPQIQYMGWNEFTRTGR